MYSNQMRRIFKLGGINNVRELLTFHQGIVNININQITIHHHHHHHHQCYMEQQWLQLY